MFTSQFFSGFFGFSGHWRLQSFTSHFEFLAFASCHWAQWFCSTISARCGAVQSRALGRRGGGGRQTGPPHPALSASAGAPAGAARDGDGHGEVAEGHSTGDVHVTAAGVANEGGVEGSCDESQVERSCENQCILHFWGQLWICMVWTFSPRPRCKLMVGY